MYATVNACIERILEELSAKEIARFSFLHRELRTRDVSRDVYYQSEYRAHWSMGRALLGEAFYRPYFAKMEAIKAAPRIDAHTVLREICDISLNTARPSVQFSFASKLLTTIDPALPVYDSRVAAFYLFDVPSYDWDTPKRIAAWLEFYDFLSQEYERVASESLLREAMHHVHRKFAATVEWPSQRVIDLLIWATATAIQHGALRSRTIEYR